MPRLLALWSALIGWTAWLLLTRGSPATPIWWLATQTSVIVGLLLNAVNWQGKPRRDLETALRMAGNFAVPFVVALSSAALSQT